MFCLSPYTPDVHEGQGGWNGGHDRHGKYVSPPTKITEMKKHIAQTAYRDQDILQQKVMNIFETLIYTLYLVELLVR